MSLKSKKLLTLLSVIIFIIYLCLLVWIITFKCNLQSAFIDSYYYFKDKSVLERFFKYIIPFFFYSSELNSFEFTGANIEDFLNVLVFIPLGIYLSYFSKKEHFLKTLTIAFLLSLCFELFQLFSTIGSFASADLITNTLGAGLGVIAFKILYNENLSEKRLLCFNVITICLIIIFIPVLIVATVNTAKIFDLYISILLKTL